MKTLVIATRNEHKVSEIQTILNGRFQCVGLRQWGSQVPEPIEDQKTFSGNAAKKAIAVATWFSSQPVIVEQLGGAGRVGVLADDSGLEVDILGGAPGVHSARFAALDDPTRSGNSPDAENNAKLLKLLADVPTERRTARFRCSLAWIPSLASIHDSQSTPLFYDGVCEGRIAERPSGGAGFGYDPLFLPAGQTLSFAELGAEFKNGMSHRAKALAAFCAALAMTR